MKRWQFRPPPKGSIEGSIRSACAAAGVSRDAVRKRMRNGMTLQEAILARPQYRRPKPVFGATNTSNGGKRELSLSQYFINAIRECLGKDPLYVSNERPSL